MKKKLILYYQIINIIFINLIVYINNFLIKINIIILLNYYFNKNIIQGSKNSDKILKFI